MRSFHRPILAAGGNFNKVIDIQNTKQIIDHDQNSSHRPLLTAGCGNFDYVIDHLKIPKNQWSLKMIVKTDTTYRVLAG